MARIKYPHGTQTNVSVSARMCAVTANVVAAQRQTVPVFLVSSAVLAAVTTRQPDSTDWRCHRLASEMTGTQSTAG